MFICLLFQVKLHLLYTVRPSRFQSSQKCEIHWVKRCKIHYMGLAGKLNVTLFKTEPLFIRLDHSKLSKFLTLRLFWPLNKMFYHFWRPVCVYVYVCVEINHSKSLFLYKTLIRSSSHFTAKWNSLGLFLTFQVVRFVTSHIISISISIYIHIYIYIHISDNRGDMYSVSLYLINII